MTAEDFEFLAEQTPAVRIRRAKALPLVHPKFSGMPIPGVVTVIVVPESDAPNPIPGDATLALVCAHLNVHRLLTSEVYVVAPKYRLVQIDASIVVKPDSDLSVVKKAVEQALAALVPSLDRRRRWNRMAVWRDHFLFRCLSRGLADSGCCAAA